MFVRDPGARTSGPLSRRVFWDSTCNHSRRVVSRRAAGAGTALARARRRRRSAVLATAGGASGPFFVDLVAFLRSRSEYLLVVRSCRACNGGLISSSGSPGECFGAGAAAPRRPQEDIFSTGFFQQVARRVCTPCSGKQADSNRDGSSNEASGLGVSEGALGGLKAASLGQQKAGGSGFRLGARNEGSSVPEAILQHGGHGPSTSSSKTPLSTEAAPEPARPVKLV